MWNLVIPISGTPEVKRLGDLTVRDVQQIEEFYTGRGRIMNAVAEKWGRARRAMDPGDTLESAAAAGRLDHNMVRSIGQMMFEEAR